MVLCNVRKGLFSQNSKIVDFQASDLLFGKKITSVMMSCDRSSPHLTFLVYLFQSAKDNSAERSFPGRRQLLVTFREKNS